jgi:hypothetical protein
MSSTQFHHHPLTSPSKAGAIFIADVCKTALEREADFVRQGPNTVAVQDQRMGAALAMRVASTTDGRLSLNVRALKRCSCWQPSRHEPCRQDYAHGRRKSALTANEGGGLHSLSPVRARRPRSEKRKRVPGGSLDQVSGDSGGKASMRASRGLPARWLISILIWKGKIRTTSRI